MARVIFAQLFTVHHRITAQVLDFKYEDLGAFDAKKRLCNTKFFKKNSG